MCSDVLLVCYCGLAWGVVGLVDRRIAYMVLVGEPAGGDLGVGGRVILKWTLKI